MKHHTELLTAEENAAIGSPSADHTGRCLIDQNIRNVLAGGRQKYEIADRPKRGPDLWRLVGTELKFTQADVVLREKLDKPTR